MKVTFIDKKTATFGDMCIGDTFTRGGVEPKTYGQYLVEKNAKKRGGVRRKRGK